MGELAKLEDIQKEMRHAVSDQRLLQLSEEAREFAQETMSLHQSIDARLDSMKKMKVLGDYIKAKIKDRGTALQAQNNFAEIHLRYERDIGRWLAANKRAQGERDQTFHDGTFGSPKLDELGIDRHCSHRWQLQASLPDDKFEEWVTDIKSKNGELTSAGLRNLAVRHQYPDNAPSPSLPEGEFDVIYVDPPWQYENIIPKSGPAKLHYGTISIDRLCDLQIPAADNATLFLWVTNPLLEDAFRVIDAWNFQYKTSMVWVKTNLQRPGAGWYVRGHHEFLLICVRGRHLPVRTSPPISSVVEADAPQHSKKPEVFYDIIERMYPNGKYVELFARNNRPGWTAWGLKVGNDGTCKAEERRSVSNHDKYRQPDGGSKNGETASVYRPDFDMRGV